MKKTENNGLRGLLLVLMLCMWTGVGAWADEPAAEDFSAWLAGLRQEALSRGISEPTLQSALDGLRPIERVVELDRRQPEFVDTFLNYLGQRVNDKRITKGRAQLRAHRDLLRRVRMEYGVPPQYLLAFWGMETNYGATLGGHPVIAALATLAYDTRRGGFFRNELLEALAIVDAGHIGVDRMRGSWAGAMGQMQFMPSTFNDYAVDADGDGRKDLWGTLPDAFASAANYLGQLGWKVNETWGREVRLPEDFDWRQARLGNKKTVNAWAALGVTRADGKPLPKSIQEGAIVLPQGYRGPAFLVYDNFERIFTWNRSLNYALAVGHLADRLVGGTQLSAVKGADNRRLSRVQALEIQEQLISQGLYEGSRDGILGSRTRAAIQAYQQQAGLPADGYPSVALLEHMQASGQGRVIKAATQAPQSGVTDNARSL